MKKIFLSAAFCLALMGTGYAQVKVVNKVLTESRAENPNFDEARKQIAAALTNPETENQAKTWFVAGMLENKAFEIERNKQILGGAPDEEKMYAALLASYNYFIKGAELDQMPNAKGKVKPKYLKDIKATLKNEQSYFINGGAYYWDKKEYGKSYEMFNIFTEIPKLNFYKPEEFVVDSNYHMIQYYAALAASQMENHDLAIAKYNDLKGTGYKENEIYQYLASEYLLAKDSLNFENTLAEGVQKFPNEPYYVQTLINIYINKGDFNKAINYLNNAIEQDPTNAQLFDVKGRLLEQEKKMDEALALYEEAIAKNPEYAAAYGNVGRIFYNRAIEENDNAANIKSTSEYEKAKKEKVEPLFKQALPYYEKAHELAPEEKEYLVALRGIYYNLDMGAEFDKIEAELSK